MTISLWLGSQVSYEVTLKAQDLAQARYGDSREDREDYPELLSVQGSVGIINISGSLVAGHAGFMSYFGVTGYEDIRDALVAAVQSPDVASILLNIGSGGGAVSGCHETAQLIARVNTIKPVVSYAGGNECSAALWLGCSAQYSYVSETSITGSLGVLMVHADRTEQLKQDGIKVTVIRAGSEKALSNPYEALSEKAQEKLQAQADAMYDIFLGHVAAGRKVSKTVADTKFGQGREFVGKQAVAAGLMDAVGTLEDAYAKCEALGSKVAKKGKKAAISASTTTPKISANVGEVLPNAVSGSAAEGYNASISEGTPMPTPLTQEHLAAIAAGVELPTGTPAAAATDTPAAEASAEAEAAATAAAAPSELLTFLQTQLKASQEESAGLRLEAKQAKDALVLAESQLPALATIARNSVKTMTVALGGKAEAVETMATAEVLAEHARITEVFKTKFKVGGVAATTTEDNLAPAKAQVSPFFAAFTQTHAK